MRMYRIAGINLRIEGENTRKIDRFLRLFENKETTATAGNYFGEAFITVEYRDAGDQEKLEEVKESIIGIPDKTADESTCYGIKSIKIYFGNKLKYKIEREEPLTFGFLLAEDSWKRLTLLDDCIESKKIKDWDWKRKFTKGGVLDEDNEWIELFLTGFYSYAALHDTMMIHASAAKYHNKAILFTAPSGTGKTTQAELWRDYAGATILNGDRIFIRSMEKERLYAWGSPWAGSSPYIVNDCAEVAAIIVLEQAKENLLRKMDTGEAMVHLSANSFLPMWDEQCLEGMLGVMDQVLRKVPVYKLDCKPNEEAVEVVKKELFG